MNTFLSLFINVKISSVVNESIGANHLIKILKLYLKQYADFLLSESFDHNIKHLF